MPVIRDVSTGKYIGTVSHDGMISLEDGRWFRIGTDGIYNKNDILVYRICGDEIYDGFLLKYRVSGSYVYDGLTLVYRIE